MFEEANLRRLSMMRFPVTDLLSEEECYQYLLDALHPEGLSCPNGHPPPDGQAPHDRSRAPIVKYRCREYGAVCNLLVPFGPGRTTTVRRL